MLIADEFEVSFMLENVSASLKNESPLDFLYWWRKNNAMVYNV